ncbi:hypothetical protein Syun_023432 [Stephania yunnanensis]|uniref:Uncharacterized protein n=1 Tax=Stephania yunnanensis TaxID=152371 RepID=A0AAP0F8Z6_9MAGN
MGKGNSVLRKENFFNKKTYKEFWNDIVKDRKFIPKMVFDKKNELKYSPRILDIIEARNWGLLNRDYNHLDLYDVLSEKGCDILVREFYANAYERVQSSVGVYLPDIFELVLMMEDQVNMVGLDVDVLPEKTITDDVIEIYGRLNGYENAKVDRERDEIARRETE